MRKLTVLVALSLLSLSCGAGKKKVLGKPEEGKAIPTARSIEQALVLQADADSGLTMRLRTAASSTKRGSSKKVAKGQKLSRAQTRSLLARLPAMPAATGLAKTFAFRPASKPVPRTGETIGAKFPPPPSSLLPPVKTSKTLEVVRFAPEGKVGLAPHLSVTFSQPMVAVTSQSDAAKSVPVELRPTPTGKWRWVGTRTLLFDPEDRMPMATRYRVHVPRSTKSTAGRTLGKAKNWTFETPPPTLKQKYPSSRSIGLEPVMVMSFDQAIDKQRIAQMVEVKASAGVVGVRLATAEEIEADETAKRVVANQPHEDRWVALVANKKLPRDSWITVTVPTGTPSAEGPLVTKKPQSFRFRTYAPLRVERSNCSSHRSCRPGNAWWIRMNNTLIADSIDPADIEIKPELPAREVRISGNTISIEGLSKPRVRYTVTLPAELADDFDQTLGKDTEVHFRVGTGRPALMGQSGMVIADPKARGTTFSVYSVGQKKLDVAIYRVQPGDWPAFRKYMHRWRRKKAPPIPGKKVWAGKVTVPGHPDGLTETPIDLSPALSGQLGHAVVVVQPNTWRNRWKPRVQTWVQFTELGIDAIEDGDQLIAWASRLEDGKSVTGAKIELHPQGVSSTTNARGIATFDLPAKTPRGAGYLVASRGKDVAVLPPNLRWYSSSTPWRRSQRGKSMRWFVFDDRNLYRPGEKVHVKGWIRRISYGPRGDVNALDGKAGTVQYRVVDSRNNEIAKGKTELSSAGSFDLAFDLPDTPNLGTARIKLKTGAKLGNSHTYHRFDIQEFRRPEFEVGMEASPGPFTIGDTAKLTTTAKYFAGGALPGAEINWNVSSEETNFTPPNRQDYSFGTWTPWWRSSKKESGGRLDLKATTDSGGKHAIELDFVTAKPPRPHKVEIQATVTDVNRQRWTASEQLLVHPADVYVGLKRDRYFVPRGTPIAIDVITVNQEGKAMRALAKLEAVRLSWQYRAGKYEEAPTGDPQACEVVGEGTCRFQTSKGGVYRITATTVDSQGRPTQTQLRTWVSGGKRPPSREVEQEKITIVPDREEYRPGQTAKLLIQAPFADAEGILTVRRQGILSSERFVVKGSTHTLEVPIADGHTPNLHVQVDLVGKADRVDAKGKVLDDVPPRPAYASGSIALPVPPLHRTLAVKVAPRASKVAPGGRTTVQIDVAGPDGAPVRSEVALVVVDESVLTLAGYENPDPIGTFYKQLAAGASDHHSRRWVKLSSTSRLADANTQAPTPEPEAAREEMALNGGSPGVLADSTGSSYGMGRGGLRGRAKMKSPAPATPPPGAGNKSIAVRKNFDALAHFAPAVMTNRAGRATVSVRVPDNLTRYRIIAVATDRARRFGVGESSLTARLPLMVRPSPPRFLNYGDRFELPIVVHNQSGAPVTVDLAVRAQNATLTDARGKRVKVPAGDRVEVRFPARAARPGRARFQFAASSRAYSDGGGFELPVWTPATSEAFATYGHIDSGATAQPIKRPPSVVTEFGGLEITTSSTQVQALTDAVLYLVRYPYECSEQLASRVMSVAALRDVLTAFDAEGLPPPKAINASVAEDIERLDDLQHYSGGFGFWTRRGTTWPYLSVHVAHALARAKDRGYQVPKLMIDRSKRYLKNVERYIPKTYGLRARRMIISYALYVRTLLGDADPARAKKLLARAGVKKLSLDSLGWLLYALGKTRGSAGAIRRIHRHLGNRVSETASTATFATSMSDGAHLVLHSSRRTDAILLEAMIETRPKSDLIPKLVRGLLGHRKRGRWRSTQENAWVLLALHRYFVTYEKTTPDFVARAWLGNRYAGDHRFKGRTTERHKIDVPMRQLPAKATKLTLQKDGKGRMYYRIGMRYAPKSLKLKPADYGFAVSRRYEPVDDANDVKRRPDGTWVIKAGARVRVRVTMANQARRYHVALVDPLPAGLEPMNPELATTGAIPQDPSQTKSRGYWWRRTWYEHQNLRDERVEAFASLLWAGVHDYSYVATATTPGTFVVPPAKAEEMYAPETFGRTGSDKVIVR